MDMDNKIQGVKTSTPAMTMFAKYVITFTTHECPTDSEAALLSDALDEINLPKVIATAVRCHPALRILTISVRPTTSVVGS